MNLCKEAGLNDYLFQVYLLQAWLQLQLGHPPRCLSILKLAYTEAVEYVALRFLSELVSCSIHSCRTDLKCYRVPM